MRDRVDLDRTVTDTVHLESLPGVVDRLLQRCHDIGAPTMTNIRRSGDSVIVDYRGPLRTVAEIRMFSALSVLLGDAAENRRTDYRSALEVLRRSGEDGVLGTLTHDGPITFRIDPLRDRWELKDLVTASLGWRNDPSDWQVNLTRDGDLLLGQVGPLHHSSRFPALRRIPASTNPMIATLLVQLLKSRSGDVIYDPFCGSGTLLVEGAVQAPDAVLLGSDLSRPALVAAIGNHPLFPSGRLLRADARRLPIRDATVDRVVSNLPFGKRVGSHATNTELYPAFLRELGRILHSDGRAVLLTEDKTLFRRSVESTTGLRILREVQLATGGLHPSAYVLERTRAARRSDRSARRPSGAPQGRSSPRRRTNSRS